MSTRAGHGQARESQRGGPEEAAVQRFPKRHLRLTTANGARLIRDALGVGGELWVSGEGQSMHPTIRHADVVLLSPLRGGVKRGDIVLVPWGHGLMLHRVDKIDDENVRTKGDARDSCDPPTARGDVLGRAIAVRRRDNLRLLTPTLRFGILPLVQFVLGELYRQAQRVRRRARRRRQHSAR